MSGDNPVVIYFSLNQKSGLITGTAFGESDINYNKAITVSIFLMAFDIRIFKFFCDLRNLFVVQDE